MGLESKLVEINKRSYEDGTQTNWGINDRLISELADEGWQMTTQINGLERVGRGNVILGLFYRKVQDTPVERPKPKAKKKDA